MPVCDECGRRFEAARSSKRYCSAACRQSAYVRRLQDEESPEKGLKPDSDFRGDFYGSIEELQQPVKHSYPMLNVSDNMCDGNDDKNDANYVTVSDDNGYVTSGDNSYRDHRETFRTDAYEILPDSVTDAKNDANSVRSLSVISDANGAKRVTVNDGNKVLPNSHYNNYNTNQTMDNWDYSERKNKFLHRAKQRSAEKRNRTDQTAERDKPNQHEQVVVLPATINSRSDDQILPVTQDDVSHHYQWIVPEFFKMLAQQGDQGKQNVEWFAKQSASYYINKVNEKWTIILCKIIQLSWRLPLLTEFRDVHAQMKELVGDFCFQSLPYGYPYKERIKTLCQNLETLFSARGAKRRPIEVEQDIQAELYCTLHELAASASSGSSLRLIK